MSKAHVKQYIDQLNQLIGQHKQPAKAVKEPNQHQAFLNYLMINLDTLKEIEQLTEPLIAKWYQENMSDLNELMALFYAYDPSNPPH